MLGGSSKAAVGLLFPVLWLEIRQRGFEGMGLGRQRWMILKNWIFV